MELMSDGHATGGPELSSNQVRTINLALQGGGAHGAFTWGVLDRLLDEKDLAFEGSSATSAGAMNAAVFAYGLRSAVAKGRARRSPTTGGASATRRGWARCSQRPSTGCCADHKLTMVAGLLSIGFAVARAVALSVQPR